MRILLISANTETLNMPTLPMGLGCVAAAVRAAGHRVRFLDLMGRGDGPAAVAAAVAEMQPQAIGISIRNIDDQRSLGTQFLLDGARPVVAACRKASRAPVVLGGAGYSLFPSAVLEYLGADMGIQGEGEVAFVQLLDCLAEGRDPSGMPGLYRPGAAPVRRAFEADLDRLPLAGPELFDPSLAGDPAGYLPFQTRRGCPLDCSYCSTAAIEGRQIRRRSLDAVLAALRHWRQAGFRRVFFVDNTFNLPPGYARNLCRRLVVEGLDLKWRCILYPGRIDADLVAAMARAGCREVSLGFESGAAPVLAAFNKRFAARDVRRAARLLADVGIRRLGFLMLGGPGETRATVEESLRFADDLALEAVKLTVGVRIYPRTALARRAVAEGLLEPRDDLLRPRFYIAPEMEEWLRETVADWCARRPGWFA